MVPEFFAYRYKGLKRIDQVDVQFAWKCRKRISWKKIHNFVNDGPILKKFADDVIDNDHVRVELYGQVMQVFLNALKWGIDKENLATPPPENEAWQDVATFLDVVAEHSNVMLTWLRDKGLMIPNSIPDIETSFFLHLLDTFFEKLQLPSYEPLSVERVDVDIDQLIEKSFENFEAIYGSVGLSFPWSGKYSVTDQTLDQQAEEETAFSGYERHEPGDDSADIIITTDGQGVKQTIIKVFSDFGFRKPPELEPGFEADIGHPVISVGPIISYGPLGPTKIFVVHSVAGHIVITFNSDHGFIERMVENEESRHLFELFFKAYALAQDRMTTQISTLETFGNYLEVFVNREFRKSIGLWSGQNSP